MREGKLMKSKVSPAFESGYSASRLCLGARGPSVGPVSYTRRILQVPPRKEPGHGKLRWATVLPAELALNFFEFGDGQFLFAVNFFDSAGDCYFFATVAELFQLLAGVVLDDIIIDGFAILFGLDHTGAFLAFMEGTHGTFGGAID